MKERGNPFLRWVDSGLGPLLLLLLLFRKWGRTRPQQLKRIAILKPAAIGDLVLVSALLTDIKRAHPQAKVTLFVTKSNAELGRLLADVDEVVELPMTRPWEAILTIRRFAFDVFIDADAWPRISALFAVLSKSRWRLGFRTQGQNRHFAFDETVDHREDRHELENYRALLKTLGVATGSPPQNFRHLFPERPVDLRVAIHAWPGGTQSHLKEWSRSSWRGLIIQLANQDSRLKFLLTGAPSDRERNEQLIADLPEGIRERCLNLAGLSLRQTMEQLITCQYVIAVNTGIMHLAAALEVPTMGLHGPTNPLRWGPVGPRAVAVSSKMEGAGQLHLGFEYTSQQNFMNGISVADVMAALSQWRDEA